MEKIEPLPFVTTINNDPEEPTVMKLGDLNRIISVLNQFIEDHNLRVEEEEILANAF